MTPGNLSIEQKAILIRLLTDLHSRGALQRKDGLDATIFCPPCKSFDEAEWNLRCLARRGLVKFLVPGPNEPQHYGGWSLSPECDPLALANALSGSVAESPTPMAPRAGGMRNLPLTELHQKIMESLWYDLDTADYDYEERGSDLASLCPPCTSEEQARVELEKLRTWDLVVQVAPLALDPDHHGGWRLNEKNDGADIAQALADGDYTVGRAHREPGLPVAVKQAMIEHAVAAAVAATQVRARPTTHRVPKASYKPQARPELGIVRVLVVVLLLALGFIAWLWISRAPRSFGPGGLPGTGPATHDMYGRPIAPDPKPEPPK